jgi:hypothetical protein
MNGDSKIQPKSDSQEDLCSMHGPTKGSFINFYTKTIFDIGKGKQSSTV